MSRLLTEAEVEADKPETLNLQGLQHVLQRTHVEKWLVEVTNEHLNDDQIIADVQNKAVEN